MLERLKTYLIYGSYFCGIEHTTKNNDTVIFVTLLKKSKNSIDIENTFQETSIEAISHKLRKKQHAFLVINNNQVLSKKIESNVSDANQIVHKAFPNINLNEFYYEVLKQNNTYFISLCRRDYIQNCIDRYTKNGILVLDIGLGNQMISSLKKYIKLDTILTSTSNISLKDNSILSIEESNEDDLILYDVNSITVNNTHLLSLGGALQPLLRNMDSESNFNDLKFEFSNNYKHIRFFNTFFKYSLIFFFGLLLVNFLFFNYYHTKVNTLNTLSEVNKTFKEPVLKLNEEVHKKETMVNDMLKSGSSKASFYTNALIQNIPKSILLSELNYQPLLKRIKNDKPIEVTHSIISVSGTSNNSLVFSEWVSELETEDWIQKIDIKYGEGSSQNSDFKLTIKLHNDQ